MPVLFDLVWQVESKAVEVVEHSLVLLEKLKKIRFFVVVFFFFEASPLSPVSFMHYESFNSLKITYTIDCQVDKSIAFAFHSVHCRWIEALFAMDFHAIPKYECEIICRFHLAKHATNCY